MKKLSVIALSLLVMGGMMASCSSNNKGHDTDTDSTITAQDAEATESAEQMDSTAAIFKDAAKKADVATDSTYAVTPSGLKYMVIKEGTGKAPTAQDEVTVHYTGKLINGQVFDSSVSRGEPATFPLSRVIPGWTEGLQLMKEGGKNVFYIPSSLAYGAAGAPPMIGPDEDLIFEVELIKVGQ